MLRLTLAVSNTAGYITVLKRPSMERTCVRRLSSNWLDSLADRSIFSDFGRLPSTFIFVANTKGWFGRNFLAVVQEKRTETRMTDSKYTGLKKDTVNCRRCEIN